MLGLSPPPQQRLLEGERSEVGSERTDRLRRPQPGAGGQVQRRGERHGVVWLLTPKAGRDGHVEPSDIDEAAPTAGLSSTRSTSAAPEWSGTRLVSPRASKGKQQRR